MSGPFLSVLFCASFGLIENSSPPLQTSAYRKHVCKQLPKTTLIFEVATPSKLSCSLLCSENMECKSFHFVATTKVCQLHNEVPDAARTSSKHDHPVYYMYVRASVVETTDKDPDQALATERYRETRILFTSIVVRTPPSQLTLEGNKSSITTYTFLKAVCVVAMSYSPFLRLIFLVTENPKAITSAVLDSMTTTSIIQGYYRALAVDERTKLLFCVQIHEIHSMTIRGSHFKVVDGVASDYCYKDIAVDSSASIIFLVEFDTVARTYKLSSMDYSGEDKHVYLPSSQEIISSLVVDPITQVLVYNLNNQVKRFNVTSHVHSDLMFTINNFPMIMVAGAVVYIMDGNTLKMFERGTYKNHVNLPHSDLPRTFCVIY